MVDLEFWTCGCLYECNDCRCIRENGGTTEDIRKFHQEKDDDE